MTRQLIRDFGTSLRLNAATSVTVPNATPAITTGFTKFAWITPDKWISQYATNATARLMRTTDDNIAMFIRQNTANLEIKLTTAEGSGNRALVAQQYLSPQTPHFVLVQYTATAVSHNLQVFVDNVERGFANKDGTNVVSNSTWSLGDTGGTTSWLGLMDDAGAYNFPFTQAQRDAAFYQGVYPSGGVFNYKFDEGSGTTATDSSGNGNHGTITNGAYSTQVVMKARSNVAIRPLAVKFTGAATSSPDINSHNGVTTDPLTNYYYGLDTPAIRKYDTSWNLVIENNLAASQAGVAHLGDSQYYNGYIYVAAENYTNTTTYDHQRIARFNASDLSFVDQHDISAQGNEISGLTIDGIAGIIYISSYVQSDKIFKYSLADYSYLGYIQLSRNLPLTQGITYRNGNFWIAEDTTKRVYKVDMYGTVTDYFRVQSSSGGGQEGLDFTGANMLVLDENSGTSQSIIRVCPPVSVRQLIGGNMVYNGDFSKKPQLNSAATNADNRWVDGTTGGTAVSFAADSYYGWATNNGSDASEAQFELRNGIDTMRISSVTAGKSMEVAPYRDDTNADHARYGIPIIAGNSYTVSYNLEVALVSGDSSDGIFMAIRQFTNSGGNVSTSNGSKVKVTSARQTYSFTFTAGANAAYCAPRMSLVGNTGTATLNLNAWFDNVQIVPTTPVTRSVV